MRQPKMWRIPAERIFPARRQTLKMCIVDLNSILAGIAARIQPIVGDKLVVSTRLDLNLASVHADPKRMDWLFVNMVADAFDGIPGGGELAITTANVELKPASAREMNLAPGEYVQVQISITQGCLEVGPVVRNIIQRIHGTVVVRETSGAGVTVDVLLPRASDRVAPVLEPRHGLDRVVLLVSSDLAARAQTGDLLREAGYRVMDAAQGKEAEAILAAGPVDLMITDIVMPEQDGLETILSVRAVYPGLKIIAIAESEGGYQLRTAKVFGADAVMSKPLVGSLLREVVREQIGGAG
jgi:two-component system, cell cycle sensor histidine kinase and response regulator CckA